ncbi:MAG: hypothetical protein K6F69_09435 [Treponema sp.]|nr:hypothetical protein [Treponema sp.]
MKRFLILLLSFPFIFASCASNESQCITEELDTKSLSNDEFVEPSYTLRTPEQISGDKGYSHNTIIVMLVNGTTADDIKRLASDFNLDIVYSYSVINGCALASKKELSEVELSTLLEKLTSDSRVLTAEKDYIYTLSDDI